jgi:ribosomal protein L6P/L9E
MIKSVMIGKAQGYMLRLALKGVGYRFERDTKENTFILHIGLTHPKRVSLPETIVCKLLKNNTILEGKCDNFQELTNNLNRIRLIKPASKDKYSGKGFYLIK